MASWTETQRPLSSHNGQIDGRLKDVSSGSFVVEIAHVPLVRLKPIPRSILHCLGSEVNAGHLCLGTAESLPVKTTSVITGLTQSVTSANPALEVKHLSEGHRGRFPRSAGGYPSIIRARIVWICSLAFVCCRCIHTTRLRFSGALKVSSDLRRMCLLRRLHGLTPSVRRGGDMSWKRPGFKDGSPAH